MFVRLEGPKGEEIIKELDVTVDTWPDVIKYEGKHYIFKYENFRIPEVGGGRIRVYQERDFSILELAKKK